MKKLIIISIVFLIRSSIFSQEIEIHVLSHVFRDDILVNDSYILINPEIDEIEYELNLGFYGSATMTAPITGFSKNNSYINVNFNSKRNFYGKAGNLNLNLNNGRLRFVAPSLDNNQESGIYESTYKIKYNKGRSIPHQGEYIVKKANFIAQRIGLGIGKKIKFSDYRNTLSFKNIKYEDVVFKFVDTKTNNSKYYGKIVDEQGILMGKFNFIGKKLTLDLDGLNNAPLIIEFQMSANEIAKGERKRKEEEELKERKRKEQIKISGEINSYLSNEDLDNAIILYNKNKNIVRNLYSKIQDVADKTPIKVNPTIIDDFKLLKFNNVNIDFSKGNYMLISDLNKGVIIRNTDDKKEITIQEKPVSDKIDGFERSYVFSKQIEFKNSLTAKGIYERFLLSSSNTKTIDDHVALLKKIKSYNIEQDLNYSGNWNSHNNKYKYYFMFQSPNKMIHEKVKVYNEKLERGKSNYEIAVFNGAKGWTWNKKYLSKYFYDSNCINYIEENNFFNNYYPDSNFYKNKELTSIKEYKGENCYVLKEYDDKSKINTYRYYSLTSGLLLYKNYKTKEGKEIDIEYKYDKFSGIYLCSKVVVMKDKKIWYESELIKAELNTTFSEKFFSKSTYFNQLKYNWDGDGWINKADKLRLKELNTKKITP